MSEPDKTTGNTSHVDLEEQLTAAKKEIIAQVREETAASISRGAQDVLSGIKQAVNDAVDLKYRVVIAEMHGETDKKTESKKWQAFLAILPVALTIALGAWISHKFDDQKAGLGTRLVLSQEYEKQKTNVYQECDTHLSLLFQALETLTVNPKAHKAADDSIHHIYECSFNHSLYVSDEVNTKLEKVRTEAIAVLQSISKKQHVNTKEVETAIKDAKSQMRNELVSTTEPLKIRAAYYLLRVFGGAFLDVVPTSP